MNNSNHTRPVCGRHASEINDKSYEIAAGSVRKRSLHSGPFSSVWRQLEEYLRFKLALSWVSVFDHPHRRNAKTDGALNSDLLTLLRYTSGLLPLFDCDLLNDPEKAH